MHAPEDMAPPQAEPRTAGRSVTGHGVPEFAKAYGGSTGAGILRADHQPNVDASVFERSRSRAAGRSNSNAEVFNLVNSVYFAAPNTVVDAAPA